MRKINKVNMIYRFTWMKGMNGTQLAFPFFIFNFFFLYIFGISKSKSQMCLRVKRFNNREKNV